MCFKAPNWLIFFSFAQRQDRIASLFMLPPILKQKIHVKNAFSALLHRLTGYEKDNHVISASLFTWGHAVILSMSQQCWSPLESPKAGRKASPWTLLLPSRGGSPGAPHQAMGLAVKADFSTALKAPIMPESKQR